MSPRLQSTTHSYWKQDVLIPFLSDSTTSPNWITGSGKPTAVLVAKPTTVLAAKPTAVHVAGDRQPSPIHGSIEDFEPARSEVDFYDDADSAAMERVAVIVRHLGLAVGVGACALAVGVVAVVSAIACRYRAAVRESSGAAPVASGYRRAATDDKPPLADDAGWTKNGYKYCGYGQSTYEAGGAERRWADIVPTGAAATAARKSLIRCDGDGDAFVTSSVMMTSSRRGGHVNEWFV